MISPNTPPGTEVMAILDMPPLHGLPGLKKKKIYIVASIYRADPGNDGIDFAVVLVGHGTGQRIVPGPWYAPWRAQKFKQGYNPKCFRYLVHDPLDATLETRAPLDA